MPFEEDDSKDRLIWTQRIGQIGDWTLELGEQIPYWSRNCYEIFERLPVDGPCTFHEILDMCNEESEKELRAALKALLENGKPFELDAQLLLPSGNIKHLHAIGTPSAYDGPKVSKVSGLIQDITGRKTSELQLRESEERFRSLFDSAREAIMTLNPPDWKFTSGNPAILDMFGVKDVGQFTSLGPWELSPKYQPDGTLSSEKAKRMIEKAMEEGSNFFEWTHCKYKGSAFPATVNLARVDLKNESFLLAVVTDITDLKEKERALTESESRLRLIADNSVDWEIYYNSKGELMYSNPAFAGLTGYENEDYLSGRITFKEIVHPDDLEETSKARERAINGTPLKNFKHRVVKKDGSIIHVLANAQPVSQNGELLGIRINIRDNTEQHLAEQTLINRERALSRIIRATANLEGEAYFSAMVNNLRESIDADVVFIGKVIQDEYRVQTLAVSRRSGDNKNFNYDLDGSPCERVISSETNIYPKNVAALFPKDKALADKKIEGYIGSPIFGFQQKAIGLIVALFKNEIEHPDTTVTLFELFTANIGSEMDRTQAVEELKRREARTQLLHDITQNVGEPINIQLSRTLERATMFFEGENGIISSIEDQDYQIEHCYSSTGGLKVGDHFDLRNTYCEFTYGQDKVLTLENAADTEYKSHPCFRSTQLHSYIGAPIHVSGKKYGTVNISSTKPYDGKLLDMDREFIQMLANWIGNLIEKQQKEDQLARSESRLKAVFNSTDNSILLMDMDYNLIDYNDHFARITKYTDDVDVFPGMDILNHISDRQADFFRSCLTEARKGEALKRVIDYPTPDGTFYFQLSYNPIFKDDEVVAISLFAENVTELKRAVDEKDTLFKELHHRVKNNLQLILSFLYLKSQDIDDGTTRTFVRELESRILSMSKIHESLLQTGRMNNMDISVYIEELVTALVKTYAGEQQIQLSVSIPQEIIKIDVALNLGLIVNEIVSNSLKYAFKEIPAPAISIAMKKVGDKEELIISDNGVGLPAEIDLETSGSTGFELIRIFVAQLDAEIAIDRTKGTAFKIIF